MKEQDFAERLKNTGRNDTCSCGSGKKYKKCHLLLDEAAQQKEVQKQRAAADAAVDDDAAVPAGRQDITATQFKDTARSKVKMKNTVMRSNAPRRQAGK